MSTTNPQPPANPYPRGTESAIGQIMFNGQPVASLLTDTIAKLLSELGEDWRTFNIWTNPSGLSRWGSMSVLMNSEQMNTTLFQDNSAIVTSGPLQMAVWKFPASGGTAILVSGFVLPNVYAIDWYPLTPGGEWWKVILADVRSQWQYNLSNHQLNFPDFTSTTEKYIASTANGSATTSWKLQDIINKLFADITSPISPTVPTLPTALAQDTADGILLGQVPTTLAIDNLLYHKNLVLLCDATQSPEKLTIDVLGNQKDPVSGSNINDLIVKNKWNTYFQSGIYSGSIQNPFPAGMTPQNVQVVFPQIPPVAEGSDPNYSKIEGSGGYVPSGADGYTGLQGSTFAWGTGTSPTTPSDPALLTKNFFTRMKPYRRDMIDGLQTVPLVGGIELVKWSLYPERSTTQIQYWRRDAYGRPPEWVSLSAWPAASYHGCISRRDPFGRLQIFVIPTGGGFFAQISSATVVTTNIWSYGFTQVEGGSTPGTVQNNPSGTSGTAYNTAEVGDPTSGIVASGWNTANFASGVTLRPIRTGAVVWIQPMPTCSTPPITVYWFTLANVVDGSCAP